MEESHKGRALQIIKGYKVTGVSYKYYQPLSLSFLGGPVNKIAMVARVEVVLRTNNMVSHSPRLTRLQLLLRARSTTAAKLPILSCQYGTISHSA